MPPVKELQVNGTRLPVNADPERTLLSVLRFDLGLTGTKYGCGEGRCGACTVLLDDKRVRSCRTPVEEASVKKIRTIEGLAVGDKLHAVQEAFLAVNAFQCGYCTSGMIMSAVALLNDNRTPSREDIVLGMNGNICRCGTYSRIIAAIELAARFLKEGAR
jgi:aerobic-type carbon monoxide dehydrogenase small subunit (CoxS/CutS family)